jgi:hypothetical protein
MEIADELNKNAEIEKVQAAILASIPMNTEITSIIIALTNLASNFTWVICDPTIDEDSDNPDAIGKI